MKSPGSADPLRKVMDAAYRILSIRSRSVEELKEKLKGKGFSESLIAQGVALLKERGYLNDGDFALEFARYLLRIRSFGIVSIVEELRRRGIPPGIIRGAVNVIKSEMDEMELLARSLHGRLRGMDPAKLDEKGKRRIVQYLYRKGFALGRIYEVLKMKSRETSHDDR